jgi:hypothetical protein
MPRYDNQKNNFGQRLHDFVSKEINAHLQQQPKSIPCHVTAVDKDFVTVAFETHDQNLTPPTVKIPQSFSPYARDPTQVGDKGYAVPSDYYLGGISGDAGGVTNYYPRGNLSPLSFQHISQTTNAERDYNQYTMIGGPNGIVLIQNQDKPKNSSSSSSSQSQQGTTSLMMRQAGSRPVRLKRSVPGQGFYVHLAMPPQATQMDASAPSPGNPGGGGTQGGRYTTTNKSMFTINGQGGIISQDGSGQYRSTTDAPNSKSTIEAPLSGKVYVGGDGIHGIYAQIMTTAGPCVHSLGRIG